MPDPFEFPRMLGAVVPFVRAGHACVFKLVADRFPSLATVIGSLQHLTEPACVLRRIQTIRINGRPVHMIDLPTGEMRSANFPLVTLPVRSQNKSSLPGTNQNSYLAHSVSRLIA